jgi:thiamine-monophosphate kinase
VQDLGHLCRQAGCGAVLEAAAMPLSPSARAALTAEPGLLPRILTGGDDYELLFAAAPADAPAVQAAAARAGVAVTRIGRFGPGGAPRVVDGRGAEIALSAGGWSHFQ